MLASSASVISGNNNHILVVHALPELKEKGKNYRDEMMNVLGIENYNKEHDLESEHVTMPLNTKYYSTNICLHFWDVAQHSICPFDWVNKSVQVIIGIPDYQSDLVLENILKYKNEIESGFIYYIDEPHDKVKDESRHWCVENNFELIVKNYKKEEQEEEESASIIDDKRGVERLMEALECTMWPDMVRHNPKTLSKSMPQNISESKEEPIAASDVKKDEKKEKPQAKTTEELLEEEEILEDEEKEMKVLDQLMTEMLFLRKEGANIPHEERKKRAEMTALKLMAMLGEEDFGSDEEDQ
ncbi:hypothetical protein C9374_004968 [Naegleria lovaniensis]|uniref:Uncharacterized protein n=1 Tax=Naegleria lovaniensis TaxID=51637 RepID=A0AA88KNV5_NAELO|nr:uncharacterized protein C9374_004968 [Naegleria lovaniensis]KAG2383001.1 hypothetical protein C9374_004968 [Naegleria lovaniensis]